MATTKTARYLRTFFDEKALPTVNWELVADDSMTHWISNEVVIETILEATPRHEQDKIADMIRRIDFLNGDVNHFLRHLARALINA